MHFQSFFRNGRQIFLNFFCQFFKKMKKMSGGILVLNQSSEKLSDRTIGDEVIIVRARARNCISSNSCLKFRFSLNLWRNALSKKRVIRKPSKIHNTYFFLHVVLLLYFQDVLSTQKYCFAIFMYTLGVVPPLKMAANSKMATICIKNQHLRLHNYSHGGNIL